ncbi:hypothetical protein WH158_07285 [Gluconobacter cerinus]|uniref:hypothetical protein n=1 Tax=Gluconobacter cerinus TaxID=38307 RepID=UPI0030A0650A
MSQVHVDQARPQTSKTLERKSTRKPRSDKGVPRGPYSPRTETRGTCKGDYWEIPLTGNHGEGEVLLVSSSAHPSLMEISDNGTKLYVGAELDICIKGPKAAAFADSWNTDHQLTVTRFITGTLHRGLAVCHINHNRLDNRDGNLIHEVKAKKTRHPINWEDAEYKREKRMEVVRGMSKPGDISPSANDNGPEIHLAV